MYPRGDPRIGTPMARICAPMPLIVDASSHTSTLTFLATAGGRAVAAEVSQQDSWAIVCVACELSSPVMSLTSEAAGARTAG